MLLRMLSPFGMAEGEAAQETPAGKAERPDEIEEMRREMDRMRERLERLAPSTKPSGREPSGLEKLIGETPPRRVERKTSTRS